MRAPRLTTMLMVLVVALAACGGNGATSTTAGPGTTAVGSDGTNTTMATVTTSTTDDGDGDDSPAVDIDAMPPACVDAFVDFLQAVEPIVADIDFATATANDLDELQGELEPVSEDFEASTDDLDCPELEDDEAAFTAMIEIAEREAPGTVGYLTLIQSFIAVGTGDVSGDCETDIAAFQVYVDQGGTMNDVPVAEFAQVVALLTSIQTACSSERVTEFFSQDDVIAFTSDSG